MKAFKTATYIERRDRWPRTGKHILAQHDDHSIIVCQAYRPPIGVFTSASPRFLDGSNVDLLHCHHRLECALGLTATSRKGIG